MATKLETVNLALIALGQRTLATIDEDQDRGEVMAAAWETTLKEFLRCAHWSWARTRDELAEASPVPDFGWDHRFTLPSNFVTLVQLNGEEAGEVGDWYELEEGYLLTDEEEAKIQYVYFPSESATDAFIERMDPLAHAAFVTLLAARTASAIVKDGVETQSALLQRFHFVELNRAKVLNANERKRPPFNFVAESRWVAARRNSTRG